MNKYIISMICLIMTVFMLSCSSDTENPDAAVPSAAAPVIQTNKTPEKLTFDQFLEHVNQATDQKNKVQAIQTGDQVRLEDHATLIAYLKDKLLNSNLEIKLASAKTLIKLGTKQALSPIKQVLYFGKDRRITSGIISIAKREYYSKYEDILAQWGAELLSDNNILKEYTPQQLVNALDVYGVFDNKGKGFLEAAPLVTSDSSKIRMKLYSVLLQYNPDNIPTPQLTQTMQTAYQNRAVAPDEIKAILKVVKHSKIKISMELEATDIRWALKSSIKELPEVTLQIIPMLWESASPQDRDNIKNNLNKILKDSSTSKRRRLLAQKILQDL